jgi:hypothetical protein
VGHHTVQLAHQQLWLEAILALYSLLSAEQPQSGRRLRRRCERLVREAINVEIDFQLDRPLARLVELGLARSSGDLWSVESDKLTP